MKIMDSVNKKFGYSKLRLSSDENGSFYLKKKMQNGQWNQNIDHLAILLIGVIYQR